MDKIVFLNTSMATDPQQLDTASVVQLQQGLQACFDQLRPAVAELLRLHGLRESDISAVLRDNLGTLQMLSALVHKFSLFLVNLAWGIEGEKGMIPARVRELFLHWTDEQLAGFQDVLAEEIRRRGAPTKERNELAYKLYVPALKIVKESGITVHRVASKLAWEKVWADPAMKRHVFDPDLRRTNKTAIRGAVLAQLRREAKLKESSDELIQVD